MDNVVKTTKSLPKVSGKGCCNLRLWCYIFGGIYAVIAFLATILSIASLAIYNREDIQAEMNKDDATKTPISVLIIAFIISAISFVIVLFMLVGVKKDRVNYIAPYVLWNILLFALTVIGSIVQFILDLVHKKGFGQAVLNYVLEFAGAVMLCLVIVPVGWQMLLIKSKQIEAQQNSTQKAEQPLKL